MDTNFIISLDSIADVNAFANTIAHFKSEIDLSSGRYIVNAKSIMGIFSLDLTRPLTLTVHGKDELEENQLCNCTILKKNKFTCDQCEHLKSLFLEASFILYLVKEKKA